jgi:hypothetical protein
LPPGEAARQAGGASELKAALTSGAASGAALGGAIGGGYGLIQGVTSGPEKADAQARDQLTALALEPVDVRRDFTVSGYIFFPKGDYKQIQFLLVDGESGNSEIVNRPWKFRKDD